MDAQHKEIQTLFIEGVNEVFSTLFNDGEQEGIYYYPQLETEDIDDVYDEKKDKVYGNPVLLVSRVQLFMSQDPEENRVSRGEATFTVPLKSLLDRGIDVNITNYSTLRQGLIRYEDSLFTIEEVKPHAFVEQVFLLYDFIGRQMLYSDLEENNFYFKDENDDLVQITVGETEE